MRIARMTAAAILAACLAPLPCPAQPKKPAAQATAAEVLVVVDGQSITEGDLARMMQTRQVPEDAREKYRRPFLEEMVDARLVRKFLADKKISASKQELDRQIQQVQEVAAKRGGNPDKTLAEMGFSAKSLREEFALPLAWKRYLDTAIAPDQMKKYFEAHRAEFDGTMVRARHILIPVPSKDESEFVAAEKKLQGIKQRIEDRKISFDEAARAYSEGPSREHGGDIGFFPYSGKMPASISHAAFRLKVGEISEPFRSSFGVHICQATERKPGELSLEDGHDEVLARLSQDLWKQTVADLRKTSKIEWKIKP